MSDDSAPNLKFAIGYVLFIDIIGYSKLLITEQSELLRKLTALVRETDQFQVADAEGKLIRIPTGDGMALVFRNSPEAPAQCALDLSKRLKAHPELQVRMGVHSGPVNEVVDVNERTNITGAGINMAQRVMDCGDAGHILLSKHVADDLEQYPQWRPSLHELGDYQVKHDVRVSVVNLYTDELGNPQVPEKFRKAPQPPTASTKRAKPSFVGIGIFVAILLLIGLAIVAVIFTPSILRSRQTTQKSNPTVANETLATAIPKKSVAVLPFENLSRDPDNAFFTDGVQDEILTDLARIADLKVISRTSVMQYKTGVQRNLREIGQALGVAHLLEGSVQRAANRVRVNAQLIDARTDAHLWAQTYDRDLADVFAIQSEIAKAIADQLQAKLSPTEKAAIEQRPTGDVAAFDLYTRAKTLLLGVSFSAIVKATVLQAVDLLNQAVARDPAFFAAYCEMARANSFLYFLNLDHSPARRALVGSAIQNAMRLRPDAGETHLAQADYFYHCYLDYDRARAELVLAKRALPNNPQVYEFGGYIDRREGRWNESARNFEKALQLDPQDFFLLQQVALSYQSLRDYPRMAEILDRAIALVPDDVDSRVGRALVDLEWRADPRPLHQTITDIVSKNPPDAARLADAWLYLALCERDSAAIVRALAALPASGLSTDAVAFSHKFCEGLAERAQGNTTIASNAFAAARTEFERAVREQPDYAPPLCVLGMIDAGLGRKDAAIREGQRAVELLPVSKDAINGPHLLKYLAVIYAWTGEKDRALEQIAATLKVPGDLSYGQLKLHPYWDPLRGDPRFEKIVASLAPKN